MNYWLLKSEPDSFSYDDLASAPGGRTIWDGVRNYQARNILRDDVAQGDLAFFYHSSCREPAIAGICRVTRTAVTDPSASDPSSPYFDARTSARDPRWITIEVEAVRAVSPLVTLKQMRHDSALQNMVLLSRSRLSVQPVRESEWLHILSLSSPA